MALGNADMTDEHALRADLDAWFGLGDELAAARARRRLATTMQTSSRLLKVLSAEELDEIRQDVLARLLDRHASPLTGEVLSILGYAKRSWTYACTDMLRKWGPRAAREEEVRLHVTVPVETADQIAEKRIDTERAVAAMGNLAARQRVALLLLSRPAAIQVEDWRAALSDHPPPLPSIPADPVDRREAASFLFNDDSGNPGGDRRRQTSFDKLVQRALAALRAALGFS